MRKRLRRNQALDDYVIVHHGERIYGQDYPTRTAARRALEELRDLGGVISFEDDDRGTVLKYSTYLRRGRSRQNLGHHERKVLWSVFWKNDFIDQVTAKSAQAALRISRAKLHHQARQYPGGTFYRGDPRLRQLRAVQANPSKCKSLKRVGKVRKVKGGRSVTLKNMASVTIIRRTNGTVGIRGVSASGKGRR